MDDNKFRQIEWNQSNDQSKDRPNVKKRNMAWNFCCFVEISFLMVEKKNSSNIAGEETSYYYQFIQNLLVKWICVLIRCFPKRAHKPTSSPMFTTIKGRNFRGNKFCKSFRSYFSFFDITSVLALVVALVSFNLPEFVVIHIWKWKQSLMLYFRHSYCYQNKTK